VELADKMDEPLGFWAFLKNMAREAWIQNPMDARLAGALNNTFGLMADLKGWVKKAPFIIQAQTVVSVETAKLLRMMSRPSRHEYLRAVRQIEEESKRDKTSGQQPS